MKKLLLILFVLLLLVPLIAAYEVKIDSITDSKIILSFSDLQSQDVKFVGVTATAETPTIIDTYIVDTKLSASSGVVYLSIDISPLKEDYSNIDSVLVTGYIESNDLTEKFSKRVSLRPTSNTKSLAPEMSSSTLIYWTVALAILFVILTLIFLIVKTPKKSNIIQHIKKPKKKSKKKTKKKKSKKKKL
jgi:preprotein translocase subunit SecG